MRAVGAIPLVAAFCLLHAAVVDAAAKSAKQWQPEEWACSPANTKNIYCPAHLQGDSRCTAEFCPQLAGCATEDCHPFLGNVKPSKLLVLDAYAVKGEKCIRQAFSLSECCSLCKYTRGCNAWSFCNSPDGCGNACDPSKHAFSWYALPQPWNDVDPLEHPYRLNPIHSCTPDGGFPFGTCSLKMLDADVLPAPPVYGGNQTGWVSGVVSPGSAASIDPVAFVLENDRNKRQQQQGDSAGGLLEEDRTGAAKGGEDSEDVVVPVNLPKNTTQNAAGAPLRGGGGGASWALLLCSCGLAALLALMGLAP